MNDYPEIKSLNDKPTTLMVFLHGLGSDGNDLISLVPYIQDRLPDYHFISPNGVEKYDMAPFGRQWFSLQDRSPEILRRLIEKNTPKLLEIIKKKQEALKINNENTVLVGFSQGTIMGTYLTLTQDQPFKAMICFSGFVTPPANIKNTQTPICIIHGLDDNIVDVSESKKIEEFCKKNHIKYELLLIPNLMHSIDSQGIEFMIDFLNK